MLNRFAITRHLLIKPENSLNYFMVGKFSESLWSIIDPELCVEDKARLRVVPLDEELQQVLSLLVQFTSDYTSLERDTLHPKVSNRDLQDPYFGIRSSCSYVPLSVTAMYDA